MPRVLIAQFVHEPGPSRIRQSCEVVAWDGEQPMPRDQLLAAVPDVDAIFCHPQSRIDAAVIAAAPRLKVISNIGAGYDNVDVPVATARGIAVCNTPGAMAETTADTAFALMVAAARRIGEGERYLRAGRWRHWSPKLLVGADVFGATLGIVGLGRIGLAMARRGAGYGMEVLYNSRTRHELAEQQHGLRYADFDTLLRESDFVSLHVPLTDQTRHVIGARELALMKPTGYLINTSRGPVVDQRALHEALAAGRIAGAGLDVYEQEPIDPADPLLTLESCVLVPHIGAASHATRARMSAMAAENLLNVLAGKPPLACVNPEVLPGRSSG
jgi:glyoxylate reductase